MTIAVPYIQKIWQETGSNPTIPAVAAAQRCIPSLGNSAGKSLWSRYVPKLREIPAIFQRAISNSSFDDSSTRSSNGPVRLICDEDEKLWPAWQYGLVGATVLLLPPRTAPLTRQSKAISGNDCVKRDLNQQALRVRRIPIRLTTHYGKATAGKTSAISHVEVRGCDGRRDSHCRSWCAEI